MKNSPIYHSFLFSMIPNPYTSEVYYNLLLLKHNKLKIDVVEQGTGRRALRKRPNSHKSNLEITNLNAGIYIIRLRPKNFKMAYAYRFVKQL